MIHQERPISLKVIVPRIGHCKKTGRIKIVSNTERLPGESSLNLQIKRTVKGDKQREITYCYFFNFNFNLIFKL